MMLYHTLHIYYRCCTRKIISGVMRSCKGCGSGALVKLNVERWLEEEAWLSGQVPFLRAAQKWDSIESMRNFITYHVLETLQICICTLDITLITYLVTELAQVGLHANKGNPKLFGLYYLSNLIKITENLMINLSDIIQTIICNPSIGFVG